MRERWAKYKDKPNLRRALMVADVMTGMVASASRGTLEHSIARGARPATAPYQNHRHGRSRVKRFMESLHAVGVLFEVRPDKTIRILEGEEARTERMRRLMVRHEFAAPDERPAIEAQMVALDAEMEGRTP